MPPFACQRSDFAESRAKNKNKEKCSSHLASICLTIASVAVLCIALGQPLTLGLEPQHVILLLLSFFVTTVPLVTGRTTIQQRVLQIVIFAALLKLVAIP